jgi:hypothetical protein
MRFLDTMKTYLPVLLAFITLSGVHSPGQEQREPEAGRRKGPREAYLEFIRAVRGNDTKTAGNWIGPGDGREHALLVIDLLVAGNAFEDALTKRFGAEVAKRFPGQSDVRIKQLEKQVSDPATKVEIAGENATISRIPDQPGPMTPIGFSGDMRILLRKHEGEWKQVPGGQAEPGAREQGKMMKGFVAVLTEITARIERDKDLTEEQIVKALNRFRPQGR